MKWISSFDWPSQDLFNFGQATEAYCPNALRSGPGVPDIDRTFLHDEGRMLGRRDVVQRIAGGQRGHEVDALLLVW
jgi:hypothetical protein